MSRWKRRFIWQLHVFTKEIGFCESFLHACRLNPTRGYPNRTSLLAGQDAQRGCTRGGAAYIPLPGAALTGAGEMGVGGGLARCAAGKKRRRLPGAAVYHLPVRVRPAIHPLPTPNAQSGGASSDGNFGGLWSPHAALVAQPGQFVGGWLVSAFAYFFIYSITQ